MTTDEIVMILGMAAVTFGLRYPVLALVSRIQLPESILSALKFVPPALLSAIILPEIFIPDGSFQIDLRNSELVASMFAVLIARRTKNLMLTIILGIMVFLGWRWVVGG